MIKSEFLPLDSFEGSLNEVEAASESFEYVVLHVLETYLGFFDMAWDELTFYLDHSSEELHWYLYA